MRRLHFAVLCGLVLGVSMARAEQPLAVYPGAVHTRIGNDIKIAGEHFRMAYFVTGDPVEQVIRHFQKQWEEEGYPTFVDGDGTDTIVSAFWTRQGLMRSVIVRRHGDKTLGFSVLKDLWIKDAPSLRGGIVSLEGTLHAGDVTFQDGPGGAQHRGHLIERNWDQTYNELRARLEAEGFTLAREKGQKVDGKQQVVLEHARRGEQVISIVTEVGPGLTVVSQTAIGSDRPDLMPNDEARRAARAQQAKEAQP